VRDDNRPISYKMRQVLATIPPVPFYPRNRNKSFEPSQRHCKFNRQQMGAELGQNLIIRKNYCF